MASPIRTAIALALGVCLTLGLQLFARSSDVPEASRATLEGFAAFPVLIVLLLAARLVAVNGVVRSAPGHAGSSRRLTAWLVAVAAILLPAFAPGAPWAAIAGGAALATAMVLVSRALQRYPDADLSFEASESSQRIWWVGGASVLTLGLVMIPVLAANPPNDSFDPVRLSALWLAGLVAIGELPAWYGRLTGTSGLAQKVAEAMLWATFSILILSVYRSETIVFALLGATPGVALLLERSRRRHRLRP